MRLAHQLFPYFGAKFRAAKRYPAPMHRTIIEPFAGGAGYSSLWADHDVLLRDTNPVVTDLWQYLIGASGDDIAAIPLLERGASVRDLGLARGPSLLIGFWCARASATPRDHLSSWSERWADRFWGDRTRDRVAAQVGRIKHWRCELGSYDTASDELATWFVDPPYVGAGKIYPHHKIDYDHLAGWCASRRGQLMVCEQAPAQWLPFKTHYTHKGIAREQRTEVLLHRSRL